MFGYVVANLDRLSEAEKVRYRAVYCGLCRALSEGHGQSCRLTLSYDMAFLILLLSALDKTELAHEKMMRCALHPTRRRLTFSNRHTVYAADLNLLLAYYQRMDDWEDDRKVSALLQAKVIGAHVEALCRRYPRQSEAIETGLNALSTFEEQGEMNPDLPAAAFGRILGEVFIPENHPLAEQLRTFGDKLGRFVYLMDAAVDLKKDISREKYNPMVSIETSRHESILSALMADCVEAFQALPLLRDRELMENILYSGVWTRYRAHHKGESIK
jgi:hypothetical protein